ncbi:MAG TPA: polyprenyl synthetase family protein [Nevskia sp.]|jgi:octaprenyl-diphosphate synthase|nr:polyprenyl synthetase family protein [Nevskia sp.]
MDLKSVLAPIGGDMGRVDALIRSSLSSEVALINEISGYIINAGGKRLRPATVLLAGRALGAPGELACLLAVVIEFIHTATLLHDDVVDHSDRRRGRKTANAVWGNSGAVLSGDFLYSRSFQLMVKADRMAVMRVMADATNAISEGEVLQLMNCNDPEVTEERYLRVIELKTSRLFQAAAEIGAIAADASPQQQAQMAAYGHAMGMAYQLVDDLLDYTADPEVSGKNLGIDLAEGKPTLPLIYTMRKGTAEQGALIRDAIVQGEAEKLGEVLQAVEAAGAIPYTRALAERYSDSAVAALGGIPDSPYKQALQDLARFTIQRMS